MLADHQQQRSTASDEATTTASIHRIFTFHFLHKATLMPRWYFPDQPIFSSSGSKKRWRKDKFFVSLTLSFCSLPTKGRKKEKGSSLICCLTHSFCSLLFLHFLTHPHNDVTTGGGGKGTILFCLLFLIVYYFFKHVFQFSIFMQIDDTNTMMADWPHFFFQAQEARREGGKTSSLFHLVSF